MSFSSVRSTGLVASTTTATATALSVPRTADSSITVAEDGSTITTVDKTNDELDRETIASDLIHGSGAYLQAGDAIGSMSSQLEKTQADISRNLGIKPSDWDFSLKSGEFKVSGKNLSESNTKAIESQLNSNTALMAAAKSFIEAAVKNLQSASDNPQGIINNIYSGGMRSLTFDNVAYKLDGNISFKAFLAKTDDMTTVHGQLLVCDSDRGYTALNYLGTLLNESEKSVGFQIFPTAGKI